jgi:hypothetical protein
LLRDAFPVALTSSISKNTSQIKNYSSLKKAAVFFTCLFIIFTQSPSLRSLELPIQNTASIALQQYYCLSLYVNLVVAPSLSYQG